ncbi:MAG: Mo-dependent nitrogenase C-terminal domain-containing protein [Trichodesmium sp.]
MLNSINAHIDTLPKFQPLNYLKKWLDSIEINNAKLAKFLCQLIPTQCPFERDISFFGHLLFHIPPLCKLNPVYDELIGLRFRAMCYLADVCGEDVTRYC